VIERLYQRIELWRFRRQIERAHELTDRILLRQRTEDMRDLVRQARAVGLA
jgi:hypothetical protein